jgi:hypothetical protein
MKVKAVDFIHWEKDEPEVTGTVIWDGKEIRVLGEGSRAEKLKELLDAGVILWKDVHDEKGTILFPKDGYKFLKALCRVYDAGQSFATKPYTKEI